MRVEHIGSTAVSGLASKPVIDVAVGAHDDASLESARVHLVDAGFEFRADQGEAGGLVFAEGPETDRSAYLHLVVVGSVQWRRYLAFRDLLQHDPKLHASYVDLKQRLARAHPDDRQAYTRGKDEFIRRALRQVP